MAGSSPALLHKALLSIVATTPRLVHTPVVPPSLGGRSQPHDGSPRKASVAVIVRIRPEGGPDAPDDSLASPQSSPQIQAGPKAAAESTQDQLSRFFSQTWVQRGTPELFFIKRASRASDRWSSHVAFPGGRQDPDDENAMFTALRETWEEVGMDLCERDYMSIGQLDDREITTSLGKRLLMVLSPFVFLHMGKTQPPIELQDSEVASAHWVPLHQLFPPEAVWGDVHVDLGSRLAARNKALRAVLRLLIGHMRFKSLLLPNEPIAQASSLEVPSSSSLSSSAATDTTSKVKLATANPPLKLWGLTLGMTLSLLSHVSSPRTSADSSSPTSPLPAAFGSSSSLPPTPASEKTSASIQGAFASSSSSSSFNRHIDTGSSPFSTRMPPAASVRAPSMAAIFPTFTSLDLNFFLWVFGSKYRRLLRRWEGRQGSGSERGFNWEGMVLSHFYAALRSALVVSIVLRSLVAAGGIYTVVSWAVSRFKMKRNLFFNKG